MVASDQDLKIQIDNNKKGLKDLKGEKKGTVKKINEDRDKALKEKDNLFGFVVAHAMMYGAADEQGSQEAKNLIAKNFHNHINEYNRFSGALTSTEIHQYADKLLEIEKRKYKERRSEMKGEIRTARVQRVSNALRSVVRRK